MYWEIWFISLLAANIRLKVTFDNVSRETAFACI